MPRRLVAGGREQDEERLELARRQPLAVDLGLDEPGRDVVARLAPARLAELAAVGHQLGRIRARERQLAQLGVAQRDLGDRALAHHLRVGVPEQLVAEVDQQAAILDRQAHDLGEDPHRDLRGDRLDPVELVAARTRRARISRARPRMRAS